MALLQELALAMQDHPDGRQTQVPKRWAAEQLAEYFGTGQPAHESIATAEEFLTAEELDSGIVVASATISVSGICNFKSSWRRERLPDVPKRSSGRS